MAVVDKKSDSVGQKAKKGTSQEFDYTSAFRVSGMYLVAGLVWIGLTDFTLAMFGGLTSSGLWVSIVKGIVFVALSSTLVFWLCQREYRRVVQTMTLLRSVIEGTTEAVFVKDRYGKYLLINTAAAQFVGRTVKELLGRDDSEIFDASEAARLMKDDQAVMARGRVVTVEDTLTARGETRTYLTTKAPYMDGEGNVIGLIGIGRNITDRKQIEIELQNTDARLREAQRIARLGSWSWEPATNHVWWSEAEFELFRIDPMVIQPSFESFLGLLHPDDRAVAIARVEAVYAGANQFSDDLRILRGDGTWIWIHSQARVTRDSLGNIVRVEGTDQDITARKQAREALIESERKLQAAVEVAGLGVLVINYQDETVELSARAAAQFGFTDCTSVSRDALHARFHPEDLERLKTLLEDTHAVTSNGCFSLEHRVILPDGTVRWLSARKQISYLDGRPHRALVVSVDVTDRIETELKLREQEMLVRESAELAKVGGWGFDTKTFKTDWTPEVAKIYQLENASAPSVAELLQFFSAEQRPVLEAALKAAVEEGIPHDLELQLTAANGEKKWVRTICRPIVRDGCVVRVRGSLQDITDRKRVEAELHATQQRLGLALQAAGAVAFVWDVPNDAVSRYFSREPALPITERIGRLDDVRAKVHPDDLPQFDTRLQACLAEGNDYRNEYRVIRDDGTVAYLEEYGVLDRGADGRPVCLTGIAINVSDRVLTIEALRSSEERLREAARVAGIGVFEFDHCSKHFFASPQLHEIYGLDRECNIDPQALVEMVLADDGEMVGAAIRKSLDPKEDGRFDVEYRITRLSDGQTRWLVTQSQTRFDEEQRKPLRTVGATIDVTDARLAGEALRTSEERYRQLVDMLPTAILVYSEHQILYGNPALHRLIGALDSDVLAKVAPMDLFDPSSHEALRRQLNESNRTGHAQPGCEMLGVRCDGRRVPVHVVAAPIEGYGANATLVALSDLTERERSAALLRSVLDSVGDAILTVDPSGTISSANKATAQLFAYSESELSGQDIRSLVFATNRGQIEPVPLDFQSLRAADVKGVGQEVVGRRKDGSTFPGEMSVTEFARDGNRELTVVLRDVTGRRQLEEQFRQSQKMEAVGRLAGGVAHDFNNLLTVINGYSEVALAELPVDDASRVPLAAIHDAGVRAARLTEQLLAFSRKSIIEPKLLNLNECVVESAKLFRRLIGEDVALSVLPDPSPVRAIIDPGQLEQILINLVVNARDAMPTGGRLTIETRTIEVGPDSMSQEHSSLPSGRYALLRVSDTGCGMTAEVKERIFEPFYTTKEVGKGTGLGLAVVHGVVQQSGGAITVQSTPGVGTSFSILLPAAEDPKNETRFGQSNDLAEGNETILVVEDEDAVRKLVRIVLESRGYTVLTAASGKEARDLLSEQATQVDLLVTDVIMPGLSGRELAESAKKFSPNLRVLFMSGYTDDALYRHGLDGTVDQFIQKPFTPLELTRKVRSSLDQA